MPFLGNNLLFHQELYRYLSVKNTHWCTRIELVCWWTTNMCVNSYIDNWQTRYTHTHIYIYIYIFAGKNLPFNQELYRSLNVKNSHRCTRIETLCWWTNNMCVNHYIGNWKTTNICVSLFVVIRWTTIRCVNLDTVYLQTTRRCVNFEKNLLVNPLQLYKPWDKVTGEPYTGV